MIHRPGTSIKAAREVGKPLAPVLFSGPPGVGKTALSFAVARELGVRLHKLHGSALRDPGFLAGWLASGERHHLVFVDEIHAVPRSLCEMLYEAMDRRRLTLPVIRGAESKTLTIELEPMSLVAATTHLAEVPEALRSRFRMLRLDLLSEQDLEKIVSAAAASLGVESQNAVSRSRIAMMASLPLATYRDVVEPYLLRAGWIEVTPRGRVVCSPG